MSASRMCDRCGIHELHPQHWEHLEKGGWSWDLCKECWLKVKAILDGAEPMLKYDSPAQTRPGL